jgi:hypothetical protein
VNPRSYRLALAAGTLLSAFAFATLPAHAEPAGTVTVSPASGKSEVESTFSTTLPCKASDTVEVLVTGGTGTGAQIPAPGKVLIPTEPVPAPGQPLVLKMKQSWAHFAETGEPVLTRLDGKYVVTVQCTNGESFEGAVEFTGTNVGDATYTTTPPTQTATATATAPETKTATATETTTATATETKTEPVPTLPPTPPVSAGALTIVGNPVAGGAVEVSGAGFKPNSPVVIGIYSEPQKLESAVADGAGVAKSTVTLPQGITGEHTLVALGTNPEGKEHAVTQKFTVATPAPAPAPESGGIPWWVWLLLGLVALGIIGALIANNSKKRKALEAWDASLAQQALAERRLVDVVAPGVADPSVPVAQSVALWNAELPAILAGEQKLAGITAAAPDAERKSRAEGLTGASVALRDALAVDIQQRSNQVPDQVAIANASALVVQRSTELTNVINAIPGVATATATTAAGPTSHK